MICKSNPKYRVQTGFRVRGLKGIITALHGVLDCEDVRALGKAGALPIKGNLTIDKVDVKRDVVLLTPTEPLYQDAITDEGLDALSDVDWNNLKVVSVIGYPLDLPTDLQTPNIHLRTPPITSLRDLIPPEITIQLQRRGSPDIDVPVVSLSGHLLHGHSGAPILDEQNRVVAVGNGGLLGGTSGITWAIPWPEIQLTDAKTDSKLASLKAAPSSTLFSFDVLPSDGNKNNVPHAIRLKVENIVVSDNGRGTKPEWSFDIKVNGRLVMREPKRVYRFNSGEKEKTFPGTAETMRPIYVPGDQFDIEVMGERYGGTERVSGVQGVSLTHPDNPVLIDLTSTTSTGRGKFYLYITVSEMVNSQSFEPRPSRSFEPRPRN